MYQRDIEPRRLELAELMGNFKRIPVYETDKHWVIEDVDTDGDGDYTTNGWFCMRCHTNRDDITSNECRRRIGK